LVGHWKGQRGYQGLLSKQRAVSVLRFLLYLDFGALASAEVQMELTNACQLTFPGSQCRSHHGLQTFLNALRRIG